jgi:hypothetical protein
MPRRFHEARKLIATEMNQGLVISSLQIDFWLVYNTLVNDHI